MNNRQRALHQLSKSIKGVLASCMEMSDFDALIQRKLRRPASTPGVAVRGSVLGIQLGCAPHQVAKHIVGGIRVRKVACLHSFWPRPHKCRQYKRLDIKGDFRWPQGYSIPTSGARPGRAHLPPFVRKHSVCPATLSVKPFTSPATPNRSIRTNTVTRSPF